MNPFKNALFYGSLAALAISVPLWALAIRQLRANRRFNQRLRADLVKTFRNQSFENVLLATFSKYRMIRTAAKREIRQRSEAEKRFLNSRLNEK